MGRNQYSNKQKYYSRVVQKHSKSDNSFFVNIPVNISKKFGIVKGSILTLRSDGNKIVMELL